MERDPKLKLSIELTKGEAEVLLKFLQDAEFPLDPFGEDTRLFKRTSKRLCVALEKELDIADKVGRLHMQLSGRWAIFRPGRDAVEITSGEVFRVEVDGELRATRMEHEWGEGYYSVDGYKLRDGMRAAISAGERKG